MASIDDIEQHLKDRGLDTTKTRVILDKKNKVATFLLFNLSGQLVGYQEYNPLLAKTRNNVGRYITHVTGKNKERMLAVWGTETIDKNKPYLFITEGIFDASKIHNTGEPAIALLSNNSQVVKPWFRILNKRIIAIMDNDVAGNYLSRVANDKYKVPDPYKDLGDMPQKEVDSFIRRILTK